MGSSIRLSAKACATEARRVDRRVQRTRAAIIEAFTQLVFKEGFESISPRKLAEAANVGRSTFYEHFSGMDELLALSIGHMFDRLAELSLQAELKPELISVIALAVTAGLRVADIAETLLVHPALAEALTDAAD